jgi:uncharacterized Tic20 family protein
MFQRLSNSWELIKSSAAVLRSDKELLIFPIISFIASLVVMATFALPMFLAGLFEAMVADTWGPAKIVGYIVAFLFYLTQYFVIIFSNTALVGAAMIRLKGGDPTVSDGIRIAFERIGTIFGYAVISATVGVILRWLQEKGVLGRIAASLFGLAWNLATFLVVPVLVVENIGPLDAVKRSASLLKQTWGEQIVGNFGIGTIFGLLTFVLIILSVPVIALVGATTESLVLVALLVCLVVILLVGLGLVSSALSGIYAAALYRYAAEGQASGHFNPQLMQDTFKPKK